METLSPKLYKIQLDAEAGGRAAVENNGACAGRFCNHGFHNSVVILHLIPEMTLLDEAFAEHLILRGSAHRDRNGKVIVRLPMLPCGGIDYAYVNGYLDALAKHRVCGGVIIAPESLRPYVSNGDLNQEGI